MMKVLKMGVVGMGFVGSAVASGFENGKTFQMHVDPAVCPDDFTIRDLVEQEMDVTFLCLPTPQTSEKYSNDVNVSIVDDVLNQLHGQEYKGLVVIKSSITPGHLRRLVERYSDRALSPLRIVYNPEFLTEKNANRDFKNPFCQIIAGDNPEDCDELEHIIRTYSQCASSPVYKTDLESASLVKYALNSFYATKVIFMNELHRIHSKSGAKTTWDEFAKMLNSDPRLGSSHLQVPGPDGQFGFGGNCFPKDTKALLHYAMQEHSTDLSVLRSAVVKNVHVRERKNAEKNNK